MSPQDQKLELLASVRLFGKCGNKEIQRLGELSDVIDLPAGRVLMRQGETGQEMMIIVEGSAEIELDGPAWLVRASTVIGSSPTRAEMPT